LPFFFVLMSGSGIWNQRHWQHLDFEHSDEVSRDRFRLRRVDPEVITTTQPSDNDIDVHIRNSSEREWQGESSSAIVLPRPSTNRGKRPVDHVAVVQSEQKKRVKGADGTGSRARVSLVDDASVQGSMPGRSSEMWLMGMSVTPNTHSAMAVSPVQSQDGNHIPTPNQVSQPLAPKTRWEVDSDPAFAAPWSAVERVLEDAEHEILCMKATLVVNESLSKKLKNALVRVQQELAATKALINRDKL